MLSVAVLALSGGASIGPAGFMDVLAKADRAWRLAAGQDWTPLFDITLVGLDSTPVRCRDGIVLQPHCPARDLASPQLVVVPAFDDEHLLDSLASNQDWASWLRKWHADGARVASSCIGAFLLAEAGLLDGRPATTHWMFADMLRSRYPAVKVSSDRLIVDAGDVITCGGATTFLSLVIYLVERFGGHERAALARKVLLIDGGRVSQLPYLAFTPVREHGDELVLAVQHYIDTHLASPIRSDLLARMFGVSPRTLARRFHAATNSSVTSYVQQARILLAKKLLETTDKPIEHIRAATGYLDPAAFRRAFRQAAGISPRQYRNTYAAGQLPTS
ncbi:GlxA family transcriptional regulator [Mycobacterium spongiae]|uniref:Helix-turn-helix domain-containing protein n=1 Tax=Mycobacterium spongiae TaxID=886343 RepID=A0A975JU80_9MYCO|nr:helix-turn-helix domain-containing protein [Mycobacterium spongiae]QUR65797.1 helix-turn-helix domain-containing protein [Mycobacterium spongiae]